MDSHFVGGLSSIFPPKIPALGGKENTDTEVTASAVSVGKTCWPLIIREGCWIGKDCGEGNNSSNY